VAAKLQFLPAARLPATASAFQLATGTISLASGEQCGVELSWRPQQHPAALFPRTITVCV
jgi:hypothetical protein